MAKYIIPIDRRTGRLPLANRVMIWKMTDEQAVEYLRGLDKLEKDGCTHVTWDSTSSMSIEAMRNLLKKHYDI